MGPQARPAHASVTSVDGRGKRGRKGDPAEDSVFGDLSFRGASEQLGQAGLIQGDGRGAGPRKTAAAICSITGHGLARRTFRFCHAGRLHRHPRHHRHLRHPRSLWNGHDRAESAQKYSQSRDDCRYVARKAWQHDGRIIFRVFLWLKQPVAALTTSRRCTSLNPKGEPCRLG